MKEEVEKEIRELCHESSDVDISYVSLRDIHVSLIDSSKNPYRSMYNMALMTWGNVTDKWSISSPETRFEVVKQVLEGKLLPLALESPSFVFSVENVSRASFDQIARARVGVVFATKGFKDNDLRSGSYYVPSIVFNDEDPLLFNEYSSLIQMSHSIYDTGIRRGYPNWAMRFVISMFRAYRYLISINFKSLQQLCSMRMIESEMEDTVATAWLFRSAVSSKFPLLANYLRPLSDWKQSDITAKVNGLSSVLGLTHLPSYRHLNESQLDSLKEKYQYKFDYPCTSYSVLEEELGIVIPSPDSWSKRYSSYSELSKRDKVLFEEDSEYD